MTTFDRTTRHPEDTARGAGRTAAARSLAGKLAGAPVVYELSWRVGSGQAAREVVCVVDVTRRTASVGGRVFALDRVMTDDARSLLHVDQAGVLTCTIGLKADQALYARLGSSSDPDGLTRGPSAAIPEVVRL